MHLPRVCMVSVQRAALRGRGEVAAHYGRRAEAGAVSSNLLILATIMMDEDDDRMGGESAGLRRRS